MRRWTHRVELADVFHNDDLTFSERRDAIVRRMTASRWARTQLTDELADLLRELEGAENEEAFDEVWDQIYDVADDQRCWIGTI